jgi:hypothetical protein
MKPNPFFSSHEQTYLPIDGQDSKGFGGFSRLLVKCAYLNYSKGHYDFLGILMTFQSCVDTVNS